MDDMMENVYKIQVWEAEELPHCNSEDQNTSKIENIPCEEATVSLELSKEDQDDAKSIADMFGSDGVKCEPCCTNKCNFKIPKDLAVQHRYSFQELEKKEKDLVILSHLQQHRRVNPLIKEYAKLSDRSRLKTKDALTRQLIHYYFCDIQICKKMYFFIHDLGSKEFGNLVKHYDEKGLAPRVHKLKSMKSNRDNALSAEDIASIVQFIKQFSEEFGRPMLRRTAKIRPPQFKNYQVVGLPEQISKSDVHKKYCESGVKKVSRNTFTKVWNQYCPYIISQHRQASNTKRNSEDTFE